MTAPFAEETPAADGPVVTDIEALRSRAVKLSGGSRTRRLLGITGAPGAGKSFLGDYLVQHLGERAKLVGMDGFHLSGGVLESLGRQARKGAPDTFDADGFVALVRRLRDQPGTTVYAPVFDRELEEPIAGALSIPPSTSLVVIEGNYLLSEDRPWSSLRDLLDEVWYVERDESVRVEQLISRHVHFGKAPGRARAWALGPDQTNAERIATTRWRADLVVDPTLPAELEP